MSVPVLPSIIFKRCKETEVERAIATEKYLDGEKKFFKECLGGYLRQKIETLDFPIYFTVGEGGDCNVLTYAISGYEAYEIFKELIDEWNKADEELTAEFVCTHIIRSHEPLHFGLRIHEIPTWMKAGVLARRNQGAIAK